MEDLQIAYRAISAACHLQVQLEGNGYGWYSVEEFNELLQEMAFIAEAFPEADTAEMIEFWQLHQDD